MTQDASSTPLVIIDYQLLLEKECNESNKLYQASKDLGFFYLKIPNQFNLDPIFVLAEEIFNISLENKIHYKMDGKNGVYFGYKPIGAMFTDRTGKPDTIEFWNISKDEIILQNITNYPEPILKMKSVIKEFMQDSHAIVVALLETLSIKLGLDSQVLPGLHRFTEPSGDQLRLTKTIMHPDHQESSNINVAFGAHTDFGSLTILHNRLGGLQVLSTNGAWLDVPPLPGHAIINLGDALYKLSNGILKSNIHRVVSIPKLNDKIDRYSVVYFARPENNVLMKSLTSDIGNEQDNDHIMTAQEWIAKRVKYYQSVNYKDETTYEMSRGTEENRGMQTIQ